MTEQDILKDRQERITACKAELEATLSKYELALTAEDMIGEHTKVHIEIQFMDLKKYDAPIAQPETVIVPQTGETVSPGPDATAEEIVHDILRPEGDPIPAN